MGTTRRIAPLHLVILLTLVAALLALAWGRWASPLTQASNEGDPTAMSFVVEGELAGSPVVCESGSEQSCALDGGSVFHLAIVPATIPPGGYGFWQTHVVYGDLQYRPRPLSEELTWDLSFFPLRSPSAIEFVDSVGHGDTAAEFEPIPRSSQKTALVTIEFGCNVDETLWMIDFDQRPDGAVFGGETIDELFVPDVPSMDIDCGPLPTPAPTQTPAPTETPTPIPPLCGDADASGSVDSRDAALILQFDAGLTNDLPNPAQADVNGDGEIDSRDATLILQLEAGLLSTLVC